MSELIELSEKETEMVGGGHTVGPIVVQNNIGVSPQVAVGVGVLSHGNVSASNGLFSVQLNVAGV